MATISSWFDGAPAQRRGGRTIRVAFLAAALAVVALIPFAAASTVSAQDPSPGASAPVLPGEPNPPWDDGAIPAVVRSDLVNVGPRTWAYVLVGPDGRTANVYFWNGTPECYGLADVRVTSGETGTRILVMTGDVPGAQACTDEVRLYRTVVVFDDPILTGGSILDLPAGGIGGRS